MMQTCVRSARPASFIPEEGVLDVRRFAVEEVEQLETISDFADVGIMPQWIHHPPLRHAASDVMKTNVKYIPEGFRAVTPYLTVRDAAQAIEFYKRAFGARERVRMPTPDGKVAHA